MTNQSKQTEIRLPDLRMTRHSNGNLCRWLTQSKGRKGLIQIFFLGRNMQLVFSLKCYLKTRQHLRWSQRPGSHILTQSSWNQKWSNIHSTHCSCIAKPPHVLSSTVKKKEDKGNLNMKELSCYLCEENPANVANAMQMLYFKSASKIKCKIQPYSPHLKLISHILQWMSFHLYGASLQCSHLSYTHY